MRIRSLAAILLLVAAPLGGQSLSLPLPPRPANAPTATAFIAEIRDLPRQAREGRIVGELLSGNVPSWNRTWVPIVMRRTLGSSVVRVTFWALPDYLAVGSDDDWFLVPLSPEMALRVAQVVGASLPTPLMVDAIWSEATVKLGADSIAPSAAMITVPVFAEHNAMVRARRAANPAPLGSLTAGHKKDVVLTPQLDTLKGRVAIYGWHRPDGTPIQPLNVSHTSDHVDYSHGIRLVRDRILIDGSEHELSIVLRDPLLSTLLSHEGPIQR